MSEILFADDDPAMRQMVGDLLTAAGHRVRLVEGGREALESLRAETPDLVILDYHMGEPHGLEVCRIIKDSSRWSHLPVLILTGQAALDDRIRGFDAGADDYLPKPFAPRELLARVRALLRLSHGSLDRNPTTRLPGGEAVQREFTRWCERNRDFAICYIDLDNFKAFNDRFGFAIADAVIREAGRTLATVVANTHSFAGHVGGDDFVLICPPEDAHRLVEEMNRLFRAGLARHLPREVFEEGWYDGIDRQGRPARLPITRMSVAIVRVNPSVCDSLARLSEVVARTKHDAKHAPGGVAEVNFRSEDGTGQPSGRG